MIENLRQHEEIMLYGNILNIDNAESAEVSYFLLTEYQREALNHVHEVPAYNENAALWAAKTVYMAAQLILYRQNKDEDLASLFPGFTEEINSTAILSADLCLRFLPDMLATLKRIDPEDTLIGLLEKILVQWHYSGISYPLDTGKLDFGPVMSDKCLQQLYADRIIENKITALAHHPACQPAVMASLGNFASVYWPGLPIPTTIHE